MVGIYKTLLTEFYPLEPLD